LDVVAGALVSAQSGQDDGVQGAVGWAVAAAVERCRCVLPEDASIGAGAAECGDGCLGGEPLWGVASGDEQRCGGVGADAIGAEQPWVVVGEDGADLLLGDRRSLG
jgi:hypothetical protein